MSVYQVTYTQTVEYYTEVEASSPEEAAASFMADPYQYDSFGGEELGSPDVTKVELVEE